MKSTNLNRNSYEAPFKGVMVWLVWLVLLLVPLESGLAAWETQLEDGSRIIVDSSTNRATIGSGPASGRPLWDGVHRLSDGSTVTIRSGVMVPTEQSLGLTQTPSVLQQSDEEKPRLPTGPRNTVCDRLVLQCCGLYQECGDRDACLLAKQLRSLQRKAASRNQAESRWALDQCKQALQDRDNFGSCEFSTDVLRAPCHYLAQHVCGNSNRCARSSACQMASQLLQFQYQQQASGQPYDPGPHNQCMQMLLENASYPRCR